MLIDLHLSPSLPNNTPYFLNTINEYEKDLENLENAGTIQQILFPYDFFQEKHPWYSIKMN